MSPAQIGRYRCYGQSGTHENNRRLALITEAGAEISFLPAYPPDLNPIELMWSKVESLRRKAETRTHDDLLLAIAHALRAVTAQDARGWFATCGYSFSCYALINSAKLTGCSRVLAAEIIGGSNRCICFDFKLIRILGFPMNSRPNLHKILLQISRLNFVSLCVNKL